jgi:hypothetical protein
MLLVTCGFESRYPHSREYGGMADTPALGAGALRGVRVRISLLAYTCQFGVKTVSADVVELAYTAASSTAAIRREGSSPSIRTEVVDRRPKGLRKFRTSYCRGLQYKPDSLRRSVMRLYFKGWLTGMQVQAEQDT